MYVSKIGKLKIHVISAYLKKLVKMYKYSSYFG